jgi:hypothetical protein
LSIQHAWGLIGGPQNGEPQTPPTTPPITAPTGPATNRPVPTPNAMPTLSAREIAGIAASNNAGAAANNTLRMSHPPVTPAAIDAGRGEPISSEDKCYPTSGRAGTGKEEMLKLCRAETAGCAVTAPNRLSPKLEQQQKQQQTVCRVPHAHATVSAL